MTRSRVVLFFAAITIAVISPVLRAQSLAMPAHAKAPASTELKLTVDGKTTTLSVADLSSMPQKTITVHNEHTKADETYTGVSLGDLLSKYGLPIDQSTHRKMLHSYISAEGTDKYWVLYSVTEIESSEHAAEVIIATGMAGKSLGDDGQLKLISTADKNPQRWVRNLAAITVVTVQ
jgi:hypothetical protein